MTDDAAAAASEPMQTEPREDVHTTTDRERLDGLVTQVRADVPGEDASVVETALRARLRDTGIVLDDAEIAALVARIAG